MQTAGDHEMKNEPKVSFEADGDALADASNFADRPPFDGCDGRVDGAQEKDAGDAHVLERLAKDARLKRGDVGGDVGQFRHCYQIAAKVLASATIFFCWLI